MVLSAITAETGLICHLLYATAQTAARPLKTDAKRAENVALKSRGFSNLMSAATAAAEV